MRSLSLGIVILAGIIAPCACSSFTGNGEAPASTDADAGGGAEGGPVTGDPGDLTFSVVPDPEVVTVVQGASAKIHVSVIRNGSHDLPIKVVVSGLPAGVSALPTELRGVSDGDVVLTAAADTSQGPIDATIEFDNQGYKGTRPVKIFVRGAAGAIDTTWATDGHRQSIFGRAAKVQDLVLAPDDSIYVVAECQPASGSPEACVAHVNAQGELDTKYGSSGVAILNKQKVHAGALQSTGKLLLVGGDASPHDGINNPYPTYVARLDALGALDPTFFNGNGIYSFGNEVPGGFSGYTDGAKGIVVRQDDDFFVSWDYYGSADDREAGSMRFSPDGALRIGYGTAGAMITPGVTALGIALRAGGSGDGDLVTVSGYFGVYGFMLTKALDGSVDPFLGQAGPKYHSFAGVGRTLSAESGIIELADGTSVVPTTSDTGLVLIKLSTTGDLAAGFGTAGVAGPFTLGAPSGIAMQTDGKLVVALSDGKVARFGADGSPDISFGKAGSISTALSDTAAHRRPVIQKSGRIVVSAQTQGTALDGSVSGFWP